MNKRHLLQKLKDEFLKGVGAPLSGVFEVDPFQVDAISAVLRGEDTLVVAPTGAGKTFVALEAIRELLEQGKRAIYTTPLKALSNTKFADFKARFEPRFSVGLLTGDRKIEGDANLVIATTEIYRNELYRASGVERYGLVVLDEVHFIADPQRGPVWEESIILTPSTSTLLMLSASISNPSEIASWLHEVRGKHCQIVLKKDRPVELRFGFLHPEFGVLPLSDEQGHLLREVRSFYGSTGLDSSGTRLQSRPSYRFPRKGRRGGRR